MYWWICSPIQWALFVCFLFFCLFLVVTGESLQYVFSRLFYQYNSIFSLVFQYQCYYTHTQTHIPLFLIFLSYVSSFLNFITFSFCVLSQVVFVLCELIFVLSCKLFINHFLNFPSNFIPMESFLITGDFFLKIYSFKCMCHFLDTFKKMNQN